MSADGVAFDASTFAVTGNPLADLVEDMAAEQKARPGQKMTLEHHISFNPYRADLSSLTEMTLGNLQVMREKSVAEERKIFSELQERAQALGGGRRPRPWCWKKPWNM